MKKVKSKEEENFSVSYMQNTVVFDGREGSRRIKKNFFGHNYRENVRVS